MNPERFVQAEQHTHEDIQTDLLLNLDDVELASQVVVRIRVRTHLFQEMPLVLNKERHRNPVRYLAVEHGLKSFSGCHRVAPMKDDTEGVRSLRHDS